MSEPVTDPTTLPADIKRKLLELHKALKGDYAHEGYRILRTIVCPYNDLYDPWFRLEPEHSSSALVNRNEALEEAAQTIEAIVSDVEGITATGALARAAAAVRELKTDKGEEATAHQKAQQDSRFCGYCKLYTVELKWRDSIPYLQCKQCQREKTIPRGKE